MNTKIVALTCAFCSVAIGADATKLAGIDLATVTAELRDGGSGVEELSAKVEGPTGAVAWSTVSQVREYTPDGKPFIRVQYQFSPTTPGIYTVRANGRDRFGQWGTEAVKTIAATTPWRSVSIRTRWEPVPGNEMWFNSSPWSVPRTLVVFQSNTVGRALNDSEIISGGRSYRADGAASGAPLAADRRAIRMAVEITKWAPGAGQTGATSVTTSYIYGGESFVWSY